MAAALPSILGTCTIASDRFCGSGRAVRSHPSARGRMERPVEEPEFLRELRARSQAEGGVFRTAQGDLAVFDPEAAQRVNAANYADLTLPDKLTDLLRGRSGDPVSWKQVRAAWTAQMRRLSDAEGIERLAGRMTDLLDGRL